MAPPILMAFPAEVRFGSETDAVPSLRISQVSTTPLANSMTHCPAGKPFSGAGGSLVGPEATESNRARPVAEKRIECHIDMSFVRNNEVQMPISIQTMAY